MTNPDNAVGTNAAYGGRTSSKAFNDDLAVYSRGIMSGWECAPDSGMSVVLGGNGTTRDVAIAEDNAGNKTTINNISGSPISVNIPSAPASNSRIDSIVAYVDNPPQGSATITDNYEACGLIVVSGTASSSPVAPTESAIRTAITADGASGATAAYVVLAYVTVASGTTDIIADDIAAAENSMIQARNIDFNALDSGWIDLTPITGTWTKLAYRIVGKICYIYGYASSISLSDKDITTLPQAIIPQLDVHFFADGVGGGKGRVMINALGKVSINAFNSTSVGYLTFNGWYFID